MSVQTEQKQTQEPREARRRGPASAERREAPKRARAESPSARVKRIPKAESPPPEIRMVPLERLKTAPENMRQAQAWDPASESGAALVESIRRHGLLHALTVVPNGSGFAVVAGGRRLQAMQALAAERGSGWTRRTRVQCSVRDGSRKGESLGVSLAENEARLGAHYVDRFDQMDRMRREGGQSAQEIAVQLGMAQERVVRLLRIERVSPELREECRRGRMRIDQLEALSGTDDHERQARVWSETGIRSRAADIRQRLNGAGMPATAPEAVYAGLAEYYRRGGRDDGGLFQEGRDAWLLDTALVRRIVTERLEEACARERAAGWGWAEACLSEDALALRAARMDRTPEPEGGWPEAPQAKPRGAKDPKGPADAGKAGDPKDPKDPKDPREAMKGLGVLVCVGRDGTESASRGWRIRDAAPAATEAAQIRRASEAPAGPRGEDLSLAPSSPTPSHLADLARDRAVLVSEAVSAADPEIALLLVAEGIAAAAAGRSSAVPIRAKADPEALSAALEGIPDPKEAPRDTVMAHAAKALQRQATALAASGRLHDDAAAERAGEALSIDWAQAVRPEEDYWERVPLPRMVRMTGRIAGEGAERALAASKGRTEAAALLSACCRGDGDEDIRSPAEAAGVEGLALEDLRHAFRAWPAEGIAPRAVREAAERKACEDREARYAARRGRKGRKAGKAGKERKAA